MAALRRLQLDQLAHCGLDAAEAAAVAAMIGQALAEGSGGPAAEAPEVSGGRHACVLCQASCPRRNADYCPSLDCISASDMAPAVQGGAAPRPPVCAAQAAVRGGVQGLGRRLGVGLLVLDENQIMPGATVVKKRHYALPCRHAGAAAGVGAHP